MDEPAIKSSCKRIESQFQIGGGRKGRNSISRRSRWPQRPVRRRTSHEHGRPNDEMFALKQKPTVFTCKLSLIELEKCRHLAIGGARITWPSGATSPAGGTCRFKHTSRDLISFRVGPEGIVWMAVNFATKFEAEANLKKIITRLLIIQLNWNLIHVTFTYCSINGKNFIN